MYLYVYVSVLNVCVCILCAYKNIYKQIVDNNFTYSKSAIS